MCTHREFITEAKLICFENDMLDEEQTVLELAEKIELEALEEPFSV
jgi:hypothetical protein